MVAPDAGRLVGERRRRPPSCPRACRPPRGTRRPARTGSRWAGWSSRPKLRAASGPAVVTTFQPARPPLTWSTRGEPAGQVEGVVVGRRGGGDQPDLLGGAGDRGEQHGRLERPGGPAARRRRTARASRRRRSSRACRARRSARAVLVVRARRCWRTGCSPAAATRPRGGRCSSGRRSGAACVRRAHAGGRVLAMLRVGAVRVEGGGRRTPRASSSSRRSSANAGSAGSRASSRSTLRSSGDPAVVEHDHPVGERDGLVDVVGDQQDGGLVRGARARASRPCILSRVRASRAPNGSSASSSCGFADQRAGQRDPLLLAAGQLGAARPVSRPASPTSASGSACRAPGVVLRAGRG